MKYAYTVAYFSKNTYSHYFLSYCTTDLTSAGGVDFGKVIQNYII